MKVLGIETSCDETAVAVYDSEAGLIDHLIHRQIDIHQLYGGVVPELAARDHIQKLLPLIDLLLQRNAITTNQINGIAYTAGPGLMGALFVGAMLGRSLAFAWQVPAIAVHHLEGHLLAVMLEKNPPCFPFLALLVSGGHTLLIHAQDFGHYQILGETLDDAAGEAFDKAAQMLGLPYPGGPAIAQLAKQGSYREQLQFPRPMVNRPGLDFSFSGLKTYCRNTIANFCAKSAIKATATTAADYFITATNPGKKLNLEIKADIAFAFETAVVETLIIKCKRALKQTGLERLVIVGGVGANQHLRQKMQQAVSPLEVKLYYPRIEFCTDNGAMIAYAGYRRLRAGQNTDLAVTVLPRWSLTDLPLP